MRSFLLGAIVGAAAVWIWGEPMRARFGEQVDGVVDRVLGLLDTLDDRLGALRDRVESLGTTQAGARQGGERWDAPAARGTM